MTRDAANTGASALATADENQIHTLQRKVRQLEAQLTNFGGVRSYVVEFKLPLVVLGGLHYSGTSNLIMEPHYSGTSDKDTPNKGSKGFI